MIPLFDLHCDTLFELYKNNSSIDSNNLHISYNKARCYSPYIQIGAIWSDKALNDKEAYCQYQRVINYISSQNIFFATKASLLRERSFILAIEDARILCNDISILDELYSDGIRILGLNWSGVNSIGGAWDTTASLTSFGKDVVKRCCELGIIVDISHSNEKTSKEVIALCKLMGGYVIASHSNAFGVFKHYRNLSDELFYMLKDTNSIVGISLATIHLGNFDVDISCVLKHIEHFLMLGGENNICLGCDFDGVDKLPAGINSIADLTKLYEKVKFAFGEFFCKKLFFSNAYHFICSALK